MMEQSDVNTNQTTLQDGAPHILVIDDDSRIRSLLSRYLSEHNFRVSTAGDTQEARRQLEGLAFDPRDDKRVLYGTDTESDALLMISTDSGAVESLGVLGFDEVNGLAFNPDTGTLYGVDVATDKLLTIDTGNGRATAIGEEDQGIGYGQIDGLTFAPGVRSAIYGVDNATGKLISIDPTTGKG